ncbi:PIN-like domain-containing protein [Bacillus thuringiensis]|uniref:PIN-like domain-containing protein n=1 Tax=Bacillus thuringiensis TaxID=1428 RepID=UPI0020C3085E|nr:PIN-like domain-containing protein [Bacillus thuringiensis]HDR7450321.1 hypothetical protein [Bacillus cereus]
MQNELEKLFIKTKTLDEMIKDATVVVDTNVLLSAYQTKPVTFDTILNILQELVDKERLKIPSHVVREFNKNRPNRIKDIANELQQFINTVDGIKNTQSPKKLNKILPAIDVLEDSHSEKVIKLQEEFNTQLNVLKEKGNVFINELSALVLKLSDYMDNDPILLKYESIIRESYFDTDIGLTEKELEDEGKRRSEKNIPPGFRDKEKGFNKYGDLIIWLQICKISNDVIFITFDNKDDWVYKDNKKNVLGARMELVQEFYKKTNGKTLKILHPSNFIDLYTEGKVSTDVTDELREYKGVVTMPAGSGKTAATWPRAFSSIRKQEIDKLREVCFYYEHEIHGYLELIRKNSAEEHMYSELNMQFELLRKEDLMTLPELERYLTELMEFYEEIRYIYLKYFNQDEEK